MKDVSKLLIVFFTIIFLIFIIEIGLRIYESLGQRQLFGIAPYRTNLIWQENKKIGKVIFKPNQEGWFVTPTKEYRNFIKINSFGFHDDEHVFEKPKNIYRILVLGDSFVASVQTPLNKTFFNQIEKKLSNDLKRKKIEIIALGMGDTGTAQQLIALKEIGLKFKPDLVIQMFLTANDLKNNSFILQNDSYRPYFVLDHKDNLKLLPHLQYSERKNAYFKDWFKNLRIVELFLQARQISIENNANQKSDYPIDYHVYDVNYNKDYRDSWKITKKILLSEKKLVEKNKTKFLLVTLANNEQVNEKVWRELKINYPNLAKSNIDLKKPDKIIGKFCINNEIDCIQMLPEFESFTKLYPNKPTHFFYDGHWNQIGTDLAAKILYEYIFNLLSKASKEEIISQ